MVAEFTRQSYLCTLILIYRKRCNCFEITELKNALNDEIYS